MNEFELASSSLLCASLWPSFTHLYHGGGWSTYAVWWDASIPHLWTRKSRVPDRAKQTMSTSL